MIAPLKLADEIEYVGAHPTDGGLDVTRHARLIAAALRLAEAALEWEDGEPTGDDMVRIGLAFDAYRAAREGA